MKLLLASSGLANKPIIDTFFKLVGKPATKIKLAFIPTAANVKAGDKNFVIRQLTQLRELGIGQIDIVDISAIPKENWLPRLQESDVIFVNGGNTTYLMKCFNESGLKNEIAKLLKSRVYVGVSAGSYIATPDIRFNTDDVDEVLPALNLVDFGLQVHYKSPKFPIAKSYEAVKKRVKDCPYTVYALDDQMAVKVVDDKHEFIGTGEYDKFELQNS